MSAAADDARVCSVCSVYVPKGQRLLEDASGRRFCEECAPKASPKPRSWIDRILEGPAAPPLEEKPAEKPDYRDRTLSEVARRDASGDIRCPVCNGRQFEATRSLGMKVLLGFYSLALPANQVRCVTCGAVFKRG